MIIPCSTYTTIKHYYFIVLILIFSATADDTNWIIPGNQYSFDYFGVIDTTTDTSNNYNAVIDNVYVKKSIKYNKHTSGDKPHQSTTIFLNSNACIYLTSNTSFKISNPKPFHVCLYQNTSNKPLTDFDLLSSLFLHIKTVVLLI